MNKQFDYKANGLDKEGHPVMFGGEAKSLQDAIGGVFSKDGIAVTDWTAVQKVQYWTITVAGSKGGKDASEVRYTFDEPEKSASVVAGLAIGFDEVYAVQVEEVDASRADVDKLLKEHKDQWV